MKKRNKIIIGIITVCTIILTSIIGFNIIKKEKAENPEILRSRKYEQVKSGEEAIDGTKFVTFDAFYLRDLDGDGYAEKLRGTCREIGQQDTLYMDLNVLTNGTLKDAKITINGKNFYFSTAIVKDNVIAQDYISSNTKEIKLNDVANGTQKLISGFVQSGNYSSASSKAAAIENDTNKYSVIDNTITLTGTHVADDGTETPITKTVVLTNDWYGTTKAEFYYRNVNRNQRYDIASVIDEENQKLVLKFKVNPRETDNKLIISKNHIEGELPLINGYAAENVTVNQEATINYDKETRIFTIDKEPKIDNGVVISTIGRDILYEITVEYPLEAYTTLGSDSISLNIPIKTWYEGYNNTNKEFENPYKSNVAEDVLSVIYKHPDGRAAIVNVNIGKYIYDNESSQWKYVISKELPINIYNKIETETIDIDKYIARWYFTTGTDMQDSKIKIKESPENYTDKFLDVSGNYIDMERYISNTGIYFSNPEGMLGEDGYINVYNDITNELIHTFTKEDWNKYTESNPFKYDNPIKHIRIETSNVNKNQGLYVYSIKEIDDVLLTAEFTRDDLDNLSRIYSYVTAYNEDDTKINSDTTYAYYEEPYSHINISSNIDYISSNETKKNAKIYISSTKNEFNVKKWINGEFLIKYPSEILEVKINNVISSDSNVVITGVNTYEEDGNIYTKIYTSNDVEKDISLQIDADITIDPRSISCSKSLELYSYNSACNNYRKENRKKDIYDINGDGNKEEYVGYSTTGVRIVSPADLLTSQSATNFNETNEEVIAPKVVEINKSDETRTSTINVNLTNNYSGTISEVKIVGKIPYKGNTFQLNGTDLNSNFNTTMSSDGIKVPDEMKEYAKVYYSYNEKVTEDINAKKNGWTTSPEDISKVKSYMICLENYIMPVNKKVTFCYDINLPGGINYNEVAYSTHAVYYCLDTSEGKLKTQTEPNKLGFRIAEKYNLDISKCEKNTTKPVSGVVFEAKDVETEEGNIATTNSEGKAILKNLYVEKEYIVKEIKTNNNYILDETETRIKGHIVNGKLEIEIIDGTTNFKGLPQIEEQENANTNVKVTIEDEVKYNFELNKTETETNNVIQGIRFELKNNNTGKTRKYTTNKDGKLNLKLLEPNIQYTLTEIETKGHYLKEPVTFMMIRDTNNNLKFNVLSGELTTQPQIDLKGEIPVVKAGLSNEKIPTYSLKITKKEKDTETTIKGAQFKLAGENKKESDVYTTDDNGIIQIDNLYEYTPGREITGEYSLQEIYPSEGYILNETPIEFKAQRDDSGNLKLEILNGTIRENIEDVQVDYTTPNNPVINITIDNDPVFTLTKVDAETGEPLEGVGFEIKDMNDNDVRDANGNLIGVKELGKVNLYSTGTYAWTKNEDGTWQSGNYNISSSTSTLTSEEFTIEEEGILLFDRSVSSQGRTSDYLYYTITNVDNNNTIGGITTKIGGTSYGKEYENLRFNTVKVNLQPGKYKIDFNFYKNDSINTGLDRGYIKNILLISKNKAVKTDTNGKIRLSLKEGLYKAIETQPLEGYTKPELYTGIGIGASKEAEYGKMNMEWENNDSYMYSDVKSLEDGVIAITPTGKIVKYDLDGNFVWEKQKEYQYSEIIIVEDSIIAVSRDKIISKFDLSGNLIWNKNISTYNVNGISAVENGFVICSTSPGDLVRYDLDGNFVWKNSNSYQYQRVATVEDGVVAVASGGQVVKCDLNGNMVWENKDKSYNYKGITAVEDGVIAVSFSGQVVKYDSNGNFVWEKTSESCNGVTTAKGGVVTVAPNGHVVKYDLDGNIVWKNTDKSYNYGRVTTVEDGVIAVSFSGHVVKYDLDGNFVWEKASERYCSYYAVTTVEDGIVAVASGGQVVKCDLNGNILWKNKDRTYYYRGVTAVEDGVVAVALGGRVVKYDLNGNIVWENTDKSYNYDRVTTVEDGVVAVAVGGRVVKYDLNGNIVWENTDKSYNYDRVTTVEDGVIAVSSSGHVVKYDLDGNFVWENTQMFYQYGAIAAIEDGIVCTTINSGGIIVKFDLDGNFVWKKETSHNFNEAIAVNDGFVVINTSNMCKYDLNGNLKWNISEGYRFPFEDITAIEDGIVAITSNGQIAKYKADIVSPKIQESQNIIVKNEIAKYKIKTSVDGIGGVISGINETIYEEVKYKENSQKDIIVTPYKGYRVQQINVNENPIDFKVNIDGTVTLDRFISMTEDKEIVVSFSKENTSLIIKKKDETSNNPLANARFNIKQLDIRNKFPIIDMKGTIVANGNEYTKEEITLQDKIEGVLGTLTKAKEADYFEEIDGKYVSNNAGKGSTTANSYIKIDLKDKTGMYGLSINANVSSESNCDYGYVTISDNTTIPLYDNSNGQFIKISGNTSDVTTPKDYIISLEGGKEYYLHLGYRKDSSGNTGDDKFTINSIDVYKANVVTQTNTYNFVDNGNGGYESNNQGQASTTANSYIPIDLTDYKGKYNLTLNANVSSQSGYDYGYATVTTTTTAPAYNISINRFVYISGTSTLATTPKDYTTVLEGGKMYYLHLGYRKNQGTDTGEDKFTVNSISLSLNQDDFVDTDVTTNLSGEAVIGLNDGRYQITEVEAPEGYTLNPEPIIYDFVSGQENVITVTNNPQVDLIVHHYIKGTTIPVAEDENIKGDFGKPYSTSPKIDLEKYQLVKKVDGSYDIPINASGTFTKETQVVTYYYELKPLEVIVHHFIDGTEDKVANDEFINGEEGQSYTTSPVTYPDLDEKYELVESKLPENANGTFINSVEEVTYYYKLKEYDITTEVDGVGGTISGQGQTPYETVLHEENSVKDIVITPYNGYEIESIKINNIEQELPENKISEYTLPKFTNVTENKHIVVKFKVAEVEICFTKEWHDDNNSAGRRPDSVKFEIYDGNNKLGEKVLTKEDGYEPMSTEDNNNGMWSNSIRIPLINENGELIDLDNLTFIEKEVNTNDLEFYTTEIRNGGYDSGTVWVYVTNTFKVPETTKDIIVTKVWSDSSNLNGKRPSQIKLQVKNGDTVVQEKAVDVSVEDTQTYTFAGLQEYDETGNEIEYTIDEVEVNENDLKFYSKAIDNQNHIITNIFTVPEDKISLNVTKKWEDNSNENSTRPSQIKLQVKNGDTVVQEKAVDVSVENEKVYTFTDLAKYGENGQEIEYTVDESEANENDLIGYSKNIEGNVITNTIKKYNITTQVKGVGGNITGKEENPYEEVAHGGNSIKDIIVIPDTGYEISKIAINDIEQTLPENKDTEYTLSKFINMTEDKHIVVEFKKKEYKITTEVEGIGGTISGQNDNPYEMVLHGENSIKDIVVTPEKGYKISSITVNGTEIEFTPNEDRTYTLEKFINMTEDKHVVVTFENIETSVVVKHQTEDGTNLTEPEIINGVVGDEYTTSEKDFDEYELKAIPENANGKMTEEQIEVIYVYSLVKGKVTITKVDKNDNSKVLRGATFKIEKLNDSGNIDITYTAQEKTTGEDGKVEFTELTVGKYRITETKAPEGYELSQNATDIEISKEQKEVSITAKDKLKLVLPATGAVNYITFITLFGLAIMIIAISIKLARKVKS